MKNQSKEQKLKDYVTRKYRKTDEFISKLDSCCTVGCNYCCHQSIEIISIEIPLIHEYIRQNISGELFEEIKSNLSNWLDFFDTNTPDKSTLKAQQVYHDFLNLSADNSLPCPFLINGLCSIYEMRPFTCRVHVVTSNPELCEVDKLRMADDNAHELRKTVHQEVKRNMNAYLTPLPFAVASIFLPKRKLKRIEKVI